MFEMSTRTRTLDLSCLALDRAYSSGGGIASEQLCGSLALEYIHWVPTAEDLRSPKYLIGIFSDIVGNAALFFSSWLFSEPAAHLLQPFTTIAPSCRDRWHAFSRH